MHRLLTLLLLVLLLSGALAADEQPVDEQDEDIPPAAPLIDEGDYDILNVLLIGSAVRNPANPGLTDTLILVSLNRTIGVVSMLSIPRDLYVYVPGFGMNKLNTAYYYGETADSENSGPELLKQTLLYNLGLRVDYYVRADFTSFMRLIDLVGGIRITVDCVIQDWRLIEPGLDEQDPDNWEMFTLRSGIYTMDADTALWYVRSRRTSSDLDRGRRQQDVLRALWRKMRSDLTLDQVPQLFETITGLMETNMPLQEVIALAPLAITIETHQIRYFRFRQRHEVSNAFSPAGQQVLLMNPEGVTALMQQVVLPAPSQINPYRPTVAIINASGLGYLPYVAADRLELEGFHTFVVNEWSAPRQFNHIVDYTGEEKDNPIDILARLLRVTEPGITYTPDPARDYDYRVYIGSQYQYWACTRDVIQPPPEEETEATEEP